MKSGYLHRICKIFLIIYLVASLSPKYVSTLEASSDRVFDGAGEKVLVHGIFWLNVVGLELLDPSNTQGASPRHAIGPASEGDEDLLLLKRKRVIYRERITIDPFITTVELLADQDASHRQFSDTHGIPHDPIHCSADGYFTHSTGLSPPPIIA